MCCYKRCEQAPESSKTEIKPKQYCVCTSFRAPFWIIWRMLVLLLSSCNWSFVSTDHKRIEMKWNSNLNSTDIFLDLFVVFAFWFIFQCFFLFCLCDTRNKSWLEDHTWHFNKCLSTSETWFSNQRKKTAKRDTDLVFQDSENCLVTGCIWP